VKFSVLTLFPQLLAPFAQEAILGKAVQRGLLEIDIFDIRSVTADKHRTVDDTPYGGGAGMVMRVDVVAKALEQVNAEEIILLTPAGEPFNQKTAEALAQKKHIALLCGRYEGFDARVETLVTRQISLGDFVMMGGEAAAACILEAVARLLPDVLGVAPTRQLLERDFGLPRVHPPARVYGAACARSLAWRQPRCDCALAQAGGFAPHPRAPPRFAANRFDGK
jgi:tRNA (guanine37-N1)-methyltransferase